MPDTKAAAASERTDFQLGEPASVKQNPWNSLEVAKLVMSSLTPVLIFAFGIIISQQSARQAETRETNARAQALAEQRRDRDAAADAARRVREESIARDDSLREANEARDDAIRRAAEERDDALRRAAEARDNALRNDAITREAAAARESVRLARLTNMLQKRGELWDQLGPLLAGAQDNLLAFRPDREEANRQLIEASRISTAYFVYFPERFNDALMRHFQTAEQVVRGDGDPALLRLTYASVQTALLSALALREFIPDEELGPTSPIGVRSADDERE